MMRIVYKTRADLELDDEVVDLADVQRARAELAFDRMPELAADWRGNIIALRWDVDTFGDAVRLPTMPRSYYVELVRASLQGIVDEREAAARALASSMPHVR